MSIHEPAAVRRQRLTDHDWLFIAVCAAVVIASVAIVIRYFDAAFPQAAIEFKHDRGSSRRVAEEFLRAQRPFGFTQGMLPVAGMKHAVRFDSDDDARIFLERSLGLTEANSVMSSGVHIWAWHHRWFKPLVEEEVSVDVAPSGEIIAFTHRLPEDRPAPPPIGAPSDPRSIATAFLTSIGVNASDLNLIDQSERRLPRRVQRIFTWESSSVRPAGAQYRHTVTVDDRSVTAYSQRLKVPESWQRSYNELRSKNHAAGSVDLIFNIALMVAAVAVFIIRLRRGDLPLRFLLAIGIASVVLVGGVAANSMPEELVWYDTTTSYPAYVGGKVLAAALQSIGTAMLLIVICGAGEVLYRQRLPKQLAMPRLWTPRALSSKRVFLGLILGYALVPLFIAYQVVFYLIAHRLGAWAPAEIPYDEMLNSAFPWVAVLFAGFFPAFSEEFLSRAFAIPTIQRIVRSRFTAIVVAGFIWGFGHATYPNQPFWIRGVEVGLAGIVAGLLMDRFGLLPLLIWHYTIDAVYTATLLFASGNTYYVVSAAAASLLFAVPLIVAIVLYVRRRGFVPDDDLTNATMPVAEPPPHQEVAAVETRFPEAIRATPVRIVVCLVLSIAALVAIFVRPLSPMDAVDYAIGGAEAKEIARTHLRATTRAKPDSFAYVIATPVEGFRSWNPASAREEGGSPGGYDQTAATWLYRGGMSMNQIVELFRSRIEAGTWVVRFFTPSEKEEIFVEVDPRTSRAVSYHRYQDEGNPASSLSQQTALMLARRAFAAYRLDSAAFDLKEALSFQQPRRRDWLFHFDERAPLAPQAHRRVTVRVAGADVTQFHKTIKIPESVYREESTQTFLNLVLGALKIIGIVALLALVIAGLVVSMREHGLPWRRPLRWSLILSVIPIAAFVCGIETMLFSYNTTTAWETFTVGMITSFVRSVGMQTGILFLALAGLEAAVPYALSAATREGRARFGAAAAVASVTALAIAAITWVGFHYFELAFPQAASIVITAPAELAIPLPALVASAQAIVRAIVFSAAVALFAAAVRKHAGSVVMIALFCAALDPFATTAQTPVMLLQAAFLAVLLWMVAKYVLDGNPLAWPLAAFLVSIAQTAAVLLPNSRPDLIANGVAAIVFGAAAVVWMRWGSKLKIEN